MTKTITKIALIAYLLPNNIYSSESKKIETVIKSFTQYLLRHGIKKFEISIHNRIIQRKMCEASFCHYPRNIFDTNVFHGDQKAPCLCQRKGPFDTKEHFIIAKVDLPDTLK